MFHDHHSLYLLLPRFCLSRAQVRSDGAAAAFEIKSKIDIQHPHAHVHASILPCQTKGSICTKTPEEEEEEKNGFGLQSNSSKHSRHTMNTISRGHQRRSCFSAAAHAAEFCVHADPKTTLLEEALLSIHNTHTRREFKTGQDKRGEKENDISKSLIPSFPKRRVEQQNTQASTQHNTAQQSRERKSSSSRLWRVGGRPASLALMGGGAAAMRAEI